MKKTTLLAGASALAATLGFSYGQAFTTPVGYHTETVEPGFNVIGVNLVDAPLVSSAVTGVAGSVLTDANVDFTASLPEGSMYSIEFTDGAWSTIASIDGANNITTTDELSVAADASYIIRKVRTLGDYFGADNSAGFQSGTATDADVIWIQTGDAFKKAYYSAGDDLLGLPAQWEVIGEDGDQSNLPIPFTEGLVVQRLGEGALDLTFTGHVKLTPTTLTADAPFTYVSRIYPTGSTLGNSGLEASVAKGNATDVTNIWLANGPGDFSKGYFSAGDDLLGLPAQWEIIGQDGDKADSALTSGYIVQRRTEDAFDITLTPPSFYADL